MVDLCSVVRFVLILLRLEARDLHTLHRAGRYSVFLRFVSVGTFVDNSSLLQNIAVTPEVVVAAVMRKLFSSRDLTLPLQRMISRTH